MSLSEASSPLSENFHHPKLEKYSGEKVPGSYIFIFKEQVTVEERHRTFLELEATDKVQFFPLFLSEFVPLVSDSTLRDDNNPDRSDNFNCARGPLICFVLYA